MRLKASVQRSTWQSTISSCLGGAAKKLTIPQNKHTRLAVSPEIPLLVRLLKVRRLIQHPSALTQRLSIQVYLKGAELVAKVSSTARPFVTRFCKPVVKVSSLYLHSLYGPNINWLCGMLLVSQLSSEMIRAQMCAIRNLQQEHTSRGEYQVFNFIPRECRKKRSNDVHQYQVSNYPFNITLCCFAIMMSRTFSQHLGLRSLKFPSYHPATVEPSHGYLSFQKWFPEYFTRYIAARVHRSRFKW
jgi:hypothetical protein